jgi:hypothetical protein
MNIFKRDPDCFKCHTAGFIINSIGNYVTCPVCKDSKIIRNAKQYVFNILLKLFHFTSDSLESLNWVSEESLRFERLYKIDTKGHFEIAEEPPFQSYDEVFKNSNDILKNKFAHKIVSSYLSGYSESLTHVETSLKTLLENQDYFDELYALAKETHNNSCLGKDTIDAFYNRLQEIREEEAKAKN